MKRSIFVVALVSVAGIAASATLADDRHREGHTVHGNPANLADRVHHFHTTQTGHKLHSDVSGGKIRTIHVRDRNGRPVAVRRVQQKRKVANLPLNGATRFVSASVTDLPPADDGAENSLPPGDEDLQVAQFGFQLFIGFSFYNPGINGWYTIWFQASWVI